MSDIEIAGGKMRVEVIDDAIVHVVFTRAGSFSTRPSVMVLPQESVQRDVLTEQGDEFAALNLERHSTHSWHFHFAGAIGFVNVD